MEEERADAEPEKADAEPVKMRSCILESGAGVVRFVVDGQVAKVLPFDTYETFHKNLTRGPEFNIFPLETADGAEIKLQLPPLSEIRAGAVELRSRDGVTYGRQYKFIAVEKEADGKSYAVVALADTGEVVEREPLDDFKRHVRFGRCRSGTAYPAMLGEVNPRLYFDITGRIYKPEEKEAPKDREAEAPEKKAAEGEKKAEEEKPEKKDPLLEVVAAGKEWLRKNPRYGYITAAVFLLVLILGIAGVWLGLGSSKARAAAMSAARLDYHLNQQYDIAQALTARDFATYARNNPQAAKDCVENLASFVEKNRNTPNLTAAQTQKMLFISKALPRLQAELAESSPK